MEEKILKQINEYRTYAQENGFALNPDERVVSSLVKALLANEEKFGKKYCPCRKIHSDDTVCPCAFLKDEIKEKGCCHCLLFVSREPASSEDVF